MAATLRITTDKSIGCPHLLAVDDFGSLLATRLQRLSSSWLVTRFEPQSLTDNIPSQSSLIVVAAAHPIPSICEELDEVCFARSIPWIPVVQEEAGITIGPIVLPGAGPCYGCYFRRLAQHALDADVLQTATAFYRRQPCASPAGFFPPAASLAAGAIADIVERLAKDQFAEAGQVRRFNILGWETMTSRVIGIHGCPRCGRGRNEGLRSTAELSNWF